MGFAELIKKMKAQGKGLMSMGQYMAVGHVVDALSPCNFLVFGLGEDASVWDDINVGGRTVFLEDDVDWISKFKDQELEIYDVVYDTKAEDHKTVGFDVEKLAMHLPPEVAAVEWDAIFVDGPLGHNPPRPYKGPGRMQSIYAAHSLLKEGGICMIDDMAREIESTYSRHFFGAHNLHAVIENKVGIFTKPKGEDS